MIKKIKKSTGIIKENRDVEEPSCNLIELKSSKGSSRITKKAINLPSTFCWRRNSRLSQITRRAASGHRV